MNAKERTAEMKAAIRATGNLLKRKLEDVAAKLEGIAEATSGKPAALLAIVTDLRLTGRDFRAELLEAIGEKDR